MLRFKGHTQKHNAQFCEHNLANPRLLPELYSTKSNYYYLKLLFGLQVQE